MHNNIFGNEQDDDFVNLRIKSWDNTHTFFLYI